MINNFIENKSNTAPFTPNEHLPEIIGYAIPIVILFLVIIGFAYYIHLIQKGSLSLSETFVWIVFTILMLFIATYLLVLQIMSTFHHYGFNLFDYLASWFGIVKKNGEVAKWMMLVILIILAFLYAKSFHSTIKISRLRNNVNTLAKEVAILNGKINDSLTNEKNGKNKK